MRTADTGWNCVRCACMGGVCLCVHECLRACVRACVCVYDAQVCGYLIEHGLLCCDKRVRQGRIRCCSIGSYCQSQLGRVSGLYRCGLYSCDVYSRCQLCAVRPSDSCRWMCISSCVPVPTLGIGAIFPRFIFT